MKKVLLVDDEKNFLVKLEAGLAEYETDFSVLTAENGEQAVDILQSTAIDLVVTDLRMPVMDGFELLAYVASNFPTIPVIIMTAFGTPEVERELNASGILTLIEKPIDLDDLAHAIIQGLETTAEEGALTGISLDSFVQLIEMEQKTCLLEIQAEGKKTSYLLFNEGELYDAIADQLKGEDAAHEIIGLRNVKIRFMKLPPRRKLKRRIDKPLMSILMEAKRLEDESHDTRNQEEALEDWAFDDDDIPPDDLILLEEELLLEDGEKSEDQKEVDALSPDTVSAGDASEEEDDPGKEDGAEEETETQDEGEKTGNTSPEAPASADGTGATPDTAASTPGNAEKSAVKPVFQKEEEGPGEPVEDAEREPGDHASGEEENNEIREIPKTGTPKGGSQMAIKDILQEMAGELDHVVATGVQGMDGVELAKLSPVNAPTEHFAARFAMIMKLAMNTCKELGQLGNLEENIMQAENAVVYTCMLGPHHYLGIAITKEGTLGMVRMVAQKYAPKFKAELA